MNTAQQELPISLTDEQTVGLNVMKLSKLVLTQLVQLLILILILPLALIFLVFIFIYSYTYSNSLNSLNLHLYFHLDFYSLSHPRS